MKLFKILIVIGILFDIVSCNQFDVIRITKLETSSVNFNNNQLIAKGNFLDVAENGTSSYGFCYGLEANPTINDKHLIIGSKAQTGQFEGTIANIEANRVFFVRAYAITGNEVTYGFNKSINTKPSQPNLSIDSFNVPNSTEFSILGSINGFGSLKVKNYGFCWSFSNNPSTANFSTQNGELNNVNSINYTINNPILDKQYHFKAYAVLTDGSTYYSSEKTIVIPTLKIQTDSIADENSGIGFWGSFKSIGVNPIQEYGFCYSNNTSNPTVNNQTIKFNNPKDGSFHGIISNQSNTTIYMRAYAIVNNTVIYGQVISKTF